MPNRTSLERFLDDALAAADGLRGQLSLLIVHLTRFREINFTRSHNEGDQLLQAVGMRIRATLGAEAFVARVSSSQFAVVLTSTDGTQAMAIAREILSALQMPFLIAGISYGLGAHVGVALAPAHGSDPATILRKAEVALFQAKQAGQACLLYEPGQDPKFDSLVVLLSRFLRKDTHFSSASNSYDFPNYKHFAVTRREGYFSHQSDSNAHQQVFGKIGVACCFIRAILIG